MGHKNSFEVGDLFLIDAGDGYALIHVLAIGKWGPLCELFNELFVSPSDLNNFEVVRGQRKAIAFINPYTLERQAIYLGKGLQPQNDGSLPPYFSGYPDVFWEIHYWDGRVEKISGKSTTYDELLARGYVDSTLFSLKQLQELYKYGKPLKFSLHSKHK